MKKITTILMMLLVATFGFAQQEVVQDFEAANNVADVEIYGGFGAGLTASLAADPTNASNQTGKIVEVSGGDVWKGIFVRPQTNYIDLTSDQNVSIDVYANSQTYFKGIIQGAQDGQTTIELDSAEEHSGNGWETLTFTFTGATGEWGEFAMRANVDASGSLVDPATEEITTYVDNLTATQGSAIPIPPKPGDELVTNGDFESAPDGSWFGNAFNIVTQGDNKLNEADVQAAGDAYAVNLSQVIELQDGKTYELSFDAFTDSNTGSRTIIAGLGQNGGTYNSVNEEVTITSTSQTFTYQFTINYGDAENDRVLFDMGAEVGFVFIDNVSVIEVQSTCNNGTQDGDETGVDCGGSCAPCPAEPSTAAPTPPARDAADVVSIFSDAYSNINVDTFDTTWCPAETKEVIIGGDATKLVTGLGCEGVDWQVSRTLDLSSFTYLHIDIWTESDTFDKSFNLKISDWGGTGGETSFIEFSTTNASTPELPSSNPGSWISLDIPISSWTGSNSSLEDPVQFIITSDLGTVYYDNLYFHKNTTLSNTDFAQAEFKAYPNPARAAWTIQTTEDMKAVQVYNIAGSLVRDLEVNASKTVISTEGLSSGVYLAKISNGSDQTKTIKLIKE
jgi:endoglucanase